MTISSTAVLTSFKVLLATLTDRETAAGEGHIDAVLKSRWSKSQDVRILFLLRHVMRQHGGVVRDLMTNLRTYFEIRAIL